LSGSLFIQNRQRAVSVNAGVLRRLARALLRDLLRNQDFDLGIYLVCEPEMTRLNETFLRHKGPTDVITFDYVEKAEPARRRRSLPPRPGRQDARPALHGEIVICLDEAVSQACQFRTSWQSELARYLIHGLLHLNGHDDLETADRRKMKRAENRLLKKIARRFALSKLAGRPKLAS
jgi:probable rRNA maturation factor